MRTMFVPKRLVFIGLGGIGSWLVEPVIRYFSKDRPTVALVDGDAIESRNLERQSFRPTEMNSYKVSSISQRMRLLFPNIAIGAFGLYVTKHSVASYVCDRDAVFLAPDNHTVRRIVAQQAEKCRDVAVFTAGNELYDGSCHVYVRLRGIELSRGFIHRHPEAQDEGKSGAGCTGMIDHGAVQLIAVNFLMAALVLMAVHAAFKYGMARDMETAWAAMPQELYGSIGGEFGGRDDGPRVRTTMVVQAALAKEKEEEEEKKVCL